MIERKGGTSLRQFLKTLSVDMGGSRVKLATVENGAVAESEMFPVSPDGFTGTLAELEKRISAARSRHPGGWDGIGIALPGIIDEERGRVLSCNAKHAGVENVDIFAWAQERLSLPCRVINDARAALLGELDFGCAKGEQNAVMMILGTGVGTSAVCRGHVERGAHGTAGLLGGHFPIQFDGGRTCNCGGAGCLEAYVGTWALKEMAGDADYDYRRLAEDYAKGDEKAQRLFATVSTALGAGALALVHLYDAETVIWSGGASHFTPLLAAAQEHVWAHAWTPWGKVRFVVADNPEASALLGLHALFAEVPVK